MANLFCSILNGSQKMPYTGDTEPLGVCGQQYQYKKTTKKAKIIFMPIFFCKETFFIGFFIFNFFQLEKNIKKKHLDQNKNFHGHQNFKTESAWWADSVNIFPQLYIYKSILELTSQPSFFQYPLCLWYGCLCVCLSQM